MTMKSVRHANSKLVSLLFFDFAYGDAAPSSASITVPLSSVVGKTRPSGSTCNPMWWRLQPYLDLPMSRVAASIT